MSKKTIRMKKTEESEKFCQFTKINGNNPSPSDRSLHPYKIKIPPKKHSLAFCTIKSTKRQGLVLKKKKSLDQKIIMDLLKNTKSDSKREKDKICKKEDEIITRIESKLLRKANPFMDEKELFDEKLIRQSLIEIKKLHDIIEDLKEFGFSSKKITHWMLKFLTKKKKIISDIFIIEQINKKSVSDAYLYEHETTFEGMKINFLKLYARAKNSKNHYFLQEVRCSCSDFKEFRIYLEEILLLKNTIKLDELKESIGTKYRQIKADEWKTYKMNLQPPHAQSSQIAHFLGDLNRLEERYGQFNLISKINRIKFHQLSEAEDYVKNQYKEILTQI